MSATTVGGVLLVLGIAFALWLVYVITSRLGGYVDHGAIRPPRGVHVAPPSVLPAVMALGGSLIGAGLAFRADDQPLANPFFFAPGVIVMLLGIGAWVRASSREWRETEHRPHDDHDSGH